MLAIGEEELGQIVTKGDIVQSKIGYIGQLKYAKDENGKETNILGFISTIRGDYLVAVKDKLIPGCKRVIQ